MSDQHDPDADPERIPTRDEFIAAWCDFWPGNEREAGQVYDRLTGPADQFLRDLREWVSEWEPEVFRANQPPPPSASQEPISLAARRRAGSTPTTETP